MEVELNSSETKNSQPTPKEIQKYIIWDHLGVVFNNLSIVLLVVCILGLIGQAVLWVASGITFVAVNLIMIAAILVTVGIVFAFPGFGEAFHNTTHMLDNLSEVSKVFDAFYSILPYYSAFMFAISLGSVLVISLNKNYHHPARKIFGIIACVFAFVVFVFTVAGGKVSWTH